MLVRSWSSSVLPFPHHRKGLGGEGLVELDDVHGPQAECGPGQSGLGGRHRADAHEVRRHPGDRPAHQPHQGTEAKLLGSLRRGHDAHRGGVVLAAGVPGGDGSVRVGLTQDRPEPGQGLQGRPRARVLIAGDDLVALPAP